MTDLKTIGIFGGTFDPVHIGHLRMALELKARLGLDEMRLLPARTPPHRESTAASTEDRAAMVRQAVESCPQLCVDERELGRAGPSYTVETLEELRAEFGPEVSLSLAVGMDSLTNLHTWHRWRDIFSLAHLVVAARPGWERPQSGPVATQLTARLAPAAALKQHAAGKIIIEHLRLLPVSSSEIRRQISVGESPQFLLPDSVWSYIRQHRLYV